MNKVLVLAVHPDDETLGCGGTLLRHKKNGDEIYWLIATSIRGEDGFEESRVLQREKEIEIIAGMYGFNAVFQLNFPTMKVDELSRSEIIRGISGVFCEVEPNIIYLPFKNDVHSDHRIIFEAVCSCTKTFRCPSVRKVLMMETISETEFAPGSMGCVFVPNYFVDISDFLDKKLNIMKVYKDEIGDRPFPRSLENIKALATFRGGMTGSRYAESYMILKEIW